MGNLLDVRGLGVAYGEDPVVHDVGFSMREGEILGIVGESGAGKSTVLHAIAGLLPASARTEGSILFNGSAANSAEGSRAGTAATAKVTGDSRTSTAAGTAGGSRTGTAAGTASGTANRLHQPLDLACADEGQMRAIRGSQISTIFQNPASTFDPTMRVGAQIAELLRLKRGMRRGEAKRSALGLLERMRFDDPERIFRARAFQLSGGMQQRAAIAMAMAFQPKLLLADEPTSALDATTQAAILEELAQLNREEGTALLLVTHNIALAYRLCDTVLVMEGGRIVESGPARNVVERPQSPCAANLVAAIPQLAR